MSSAADAGKEAAGMEALHLLKSTEPPLYLTPSPELSKAARLASECLFASLSPYAPKYPLNQLCTEGFDAEQIWEQIDLQSQPLLSSLRRQVRNFENNPSEIEKQFNFDRDSGKEEKLREDGKNKENDGVESESEDLDDDDDDEEEEEEEDDDEDDEELENEEGENVTGVEDKFLKIKELEKYLKEDEAREYGGKKEKKNKRKRGKIADEDEEDDDEDDDDELGLMGIEDDGENGSDIENPRYEDFFTSQKTSQNKKSKYDDDEEEDDDEEDDDDEESDDTDMDEPENDDSNQNQQSLAVPEQDLGKLRAKVEEMEKANMQGKTKQSLSTHEKELEALRAEIEEMERANMEPKTWTMQGEVTAAKRPQNSALEVDLDFEQNVRPPPLITEKETASLEELIMKRISEGQFDDVQRPPTLLNKAPKERKELDENKSKKGLAELYEEKYAQKTGLVSAALSFSDEQKKEASVLFKKLCVKLDALSHFHFAPKPVIEDMSIQANVPALAIEEVAPLAVSDAAMLAPEEVFSGKGDIKEETELSKADRKRRRAKKKRQFKAESVKRMAVKTQQSTLIKPDNGNGES